MAKEEHILLKWTVENQKLELHADIDCNTQHAAAVLVQMFKNNPKLMEEFITADPDGLSEFSRKSL